jgi:ABC-type transport system involved in multi-copper enzyme maturation permease subunit
MMPLVMRVPDFSLPLLAKELTEQSARGRTFAVRAAYAGLLYAVTLWGFYRQIGGTSGAFGMLGTGNLLFEQVLSFQRFAIFALLPMLTAGVLTSEKERDTLGILLITRLGAWTIILEKFLSRVIPMLLYLLLSLPLLAVAYSLGGVDSWMVLWAGMMLVAGVLHVGSIGVFASAYCRTTTQALILTYVLMLFVAAVGTFVAPTLAWTFRSFGLGAFSDGLMLVLVGPLSTLFWLLLARLSLWRRAFLQPKFWWLQLLKWFDGVFHQLNQNRVTRGIVLLDDRVELPVDQPIAWRETKKRSLGTMRYQLRFLLLVEGPLAFWLVIPLSDPTIWTARKSGPIEFAAFAVWWVTAFAVMAISTALVAGERSRQSLDVLLSTPLTADEIVTEKFAGVRRMIAVLWIPLLTVFVVRGWWYSSMEQSWRFHSAVFVIQSLGSTIIYPPLLGWLGFHCGLRFKSQVTAMTAALGVAVAVGGLPWALNWVGVFRPDPDFGMNMNLLAVASSVILPATGPNASPFYEGVRRYGSMSGVGMPGPGAWGAPVLLLIHFALYYLLWRYLKALAPRELVRHSGRCEQWTHTTPTERPVCERPRLLLRS